MMKTLIKVKGAVPLLFLLLTVTAFAQHSDVGSDEEIILFPGVMRPVDDGKVWELDVRGLVCEPEQRRVMLALFREAMDVRRVSRTKEEDAMFAERARFFMVDNERGKEIVVRIGERRVVLEESGADGIFAGKVRLTAQEAKELRAGATNGAIVFEALTRPGDTRRFAGEAHPWEQSGLTVISDIDDTIKVTNVRDRNATLRNTFLRPFEPITGMAELYQGWSATNGAQFFYLSASPWQLYVPLAEFVRSNGFPSGVFQLKTFRWKDQTFFSLFADPQEYKARVLEPILERYPERSFVLVGDSGERDPEIYAGLARKYPTQVVRIFIRDVTGETADAARYQNTFRNLPRALWTIFRDPAELKSETLEPRP